MKNIINYYYNLKIVDMKQSDGVISFDIENNKYVFIPYRRELDSISVIYQLNQMLLARKIPVHQIILNIQGQILTYINGEYYVLMKLFIYEGSFKISDVLLLNGIEIEMKKNFLNRNTWGKLWSEKNDYLEYQVSQLGKKYPLIRNSFSYYIGLSEMCISLCNEIDTSNLKLYLSHNRIKKDYSFYELYNPFNIVLDFKIRDASEYFKSCFFYKEEDIKNEINYFLSHNSLLYEEWILFFIRMLYPSYYFDCYEEIINDKIEENNLLKIISKNEEYEKILLLIYNRLRGFNNFPIIDYFENKKHQY